MSDLDINTERGQVSLKHERRAIELLGSRWPGVKFIDTEKTGGAVIDGFIIVDDVLKGIAEVKARDMNFETLTKVFRTEWLVTYDKIVGCREIADGMQTNFWGLLYLIPDDLLLLKCLYKHKGGWQAGFRVDKTDTQATCNGGAARRDNAFIDMKGAIQIAAPAPSAPNE